MKMNLKPAEFYRNYANAIGLLYECGFDASNYITYIDGVVYDYDHNLVDIVRALNYLECKYDTTTLKRLIKMGFSKYRYYYDKDEDGYVDEWYHYNILSTMHSVVMNDMVYITKLPSEILDFLPNNDNIKMHLVDKERGYIIINYYYHV
jgi:hypothetical protein